MRNFLKLYKHTQDKVKLNQVVIKLYKSLRINNFTKFKLQFMIPQQLDINNSEHY